MSVQPRALVLNAPGINCNLETAFAVEQAGGYADQVHVNELFAGERSLDDYQMLFLSGGFSHGDDIASGRLLGLELRKKLPEELNRFVDAGKAIVGICNGFQVLVESGLLPEGRINEDRKKITSLDTNTNKKFECRWGKLVVAESVCQFTEGLEGLVVDLPSAHGEGLFRHNYTGHDLAADGQIVFQYCDAEGSPTMAYPGNPNGSLGGVTGICDPNGTILGMMPHPERAVLETQLPNWRRDGSQEPFGAILFQGIVDYSRNQ